MGHKMQKFAIAPELWKPVVDYEGLYEVSNYGRIRSLDKHANQTNTGPRRINRTTFYHGKILKPFTFSKTGYLGIELNHNSIAKKHLVHRLVAAAFIPNPNNLPQVNHKDENKSNNHVDNLEWCTRQYNNAYGTARQRQAATLFKGVIQINKDTGKIIQEFCSITDAAKSTGTNRVKIGCVCRGTRKTAGGYVWKYAIATNKEYPAPKKYRVANYRDQS